MPLEYMAKYVRLPMDPVSDTDSDCASFCDAEAHRHHASEVTQARELRGNSHGSKTEAYN